MVWDSGFKVILKATVRTFCFFNMFFCGQVGLWECGMFVPVVGT